jgi:hypothetical protein
LPNGGEFLVFLFEFGGAPFVVFFKYRFLEVLSPSRWVSVRCNLYPGGAVEELRQDGFGCVKTVFPQNELACKQTLRPIVQ